MHQPPRSAAPGQLLGELVEAPGPQEPVTVGIARAWPPLHRGGFDRLELGRHEGGWM